MSFNIVEMVSDEEQAFDQPCKHGNRVGGHSVYCHSEKAGYRKCFYRWESQRRHEANECGGYEANPLWDSSGEIEMKRREHDTPAANLQSKGTHP